MTFEMEKNTVNNISINDTSESIEWYQLIELD